MRENPPTGHFSRRAREKKLCYLSRISTDALLRSIGTNFGLRVRLVDVIYCAKVYRNRKGFGFCEGPNFDHCHRNAMSPLILLELMFRCDLVLFLHYVVNNCCLIPYTV